MKSNPEIEAILERSLRRQVNAPRLGKSFDTSVWARIEAEESKTTAHTAVRSPSASRAGRWIFIVNSLGIACVAVFLCVFLFRWLAGVQVESSIPDLSLQISDQNASAWSTGIAGAALLFGFLYTPWGRRLREELF